MDIFKNPETIEEGAQNVKDFIFNKLNIALSNDDPIIAEYLILSEFYKKQTDLLSSMSQLNNFLKDIKQSQQELATIYHKQSTKIIANQTAVNRKTFTEAVNQVLNQTREIVEDNTYAAKQRQLILHFWLIATLITLVNISITVLIFYISK